MSLTLQLKLLALNILTLTVIAANVLYINYLVRFRSGLNDNEMLRRFWSKAEHIILAPPKFAFMLDLYLGLGINALTRCILKGTLHLIDSNHISLMGEFVVTCASTAAGSILGISLYNFDGGDKFIVFSLASAICCLPQGLFKLLTSFREHQTLTWGIWTASILSVAVLSSFIVLKMIPTNKAAPPTRGFFEGGTPLEYNKTSLSKITMALSVLVVIISFTLHAVLLLLLRAYVRTREYQNQYLARLLLDFAGLMPLMNFSAIVINNLVLLIHSSNDLKHWRLFSVYALPQAAYGIKVALEVFTAKDRFFNHILFEVLIMMFVFAAVGFISSAAYFTVCLRAAKKALDPGVDLQNELILDDDDYEEYDI